MHSGQQDWPDVAFSNGSAVVVADAACVLTAVVFLMHRVFVEPSLNSMAAWMTPRMDYCSFLCDAVEHDAGGA
jgi:hypothetical protein